MKRMTKLSTNDLLSAKESYRADHPTKDFDTSCQQAQVMEKLILSISEYENHREDYDGFCKECNQITNMGGVEPDAEGYECILCDQMSVVGMENAMIEKLFLIRG